MRYKRGCGRYLGGVIVFVMISIVFAVPASAQTPETDDTPSGDAGETQSGLDQVIDLLEKKGVISHQEAEALKRRQVSSEMQPEQRAEPSPEPGGGSDEEENRSEIQRLEEKIERQMDHVQTNTRLNTRKIEQLEEQRIDRLADENRKSSWAQRISLAGDIRVRYQKDLFDDDNGMFYRPENPDDDNLMNSTEDRERFRARLRLALKANIVDPRDINVGKVVAGIRVTTGNTDDPVSTNDTMGDYFNKDSIVLDRYFLKWSYAPELPVWGRIPQVNLTVGRMPNPWFSSDLVWDDDLNFEGATLNLLTDTLEANGWYIFFTAGAYPLQELEIEKDDKWLYAGQVGFHMTPLYGLGVTLGAAYYDYQNITGRANDPLEPGLYDYTAPAYMQKGNTLFYIDPPDDTLTALAAEYKIVDITGEVDISYFFPVHIILGGTYAKNIGFDQEEVSRRVGVERVPEETEAYRLALKVGYPVIFNFGEWNFFYEYKYIGADAVLDAFTDSDFHLGGTDAKGWIAGIELGLYRNVWLRTRWITSDAIIDDPYVNDRFAIDTFQLDINARF